MKKNFFIIWIGVGVLLIFFWIYFPTLSRYRDLKIEEDRITRELTDLDTKIQALQAERNLLKNDVEYLEKVIRRELGLVKPGEMIYRLVPEEKKKKPKSEEQAPETIPAPTAPQNPPPATAQSNAPPLTEGEVVYPRQEIR